MRRVAARAGCSTTVIYTLFGGKEGVVNGLYLEGFRRLRRALDAADETGALGRLRLLNRTCRRVALENPTYYAVMFERPVPGYRPDDPGVSEPRRFSARSRRNHGHGAELWVVAHGLVSVELAGCFPGKTASADAVHEGALDDLIRAWSQGWHFKTLKY